MSERYIPKVQDRLLDMWAILDCLNDHYVRHQHINKFGSAEEEVWRFNHQESAQYHADILNAEEAVSDSEVDSRA
jgi:hypothetical protein